MPARACLAGLVALVAGSMPGTANAQERGSFRLRGACAVQAVLEEIHARGPRETSRDRFLVLGRPAHPGRYVQCIFVDGDARMRCEAASGAYAPRGDGAHAPMPGPDAVAALRALGFTQPGPRSNFELDIELGTPPRLAEVARLMLAALRRAYGADPAEDLVAVAPKADDRAPCRRGCDCGPTSRAPGTPATSGTRA